MKVQLLITACCLLSFLPKAAADEARFFREQGTHFGVYCYPEHWPEVQWERDIRRVAEIPVADSAEILCGDRKLPPGGVLVWRE